MYKLILLMALMTVSGILSLDAQNRQIIKMDATGTSYGDDITDDEKIVIQNAAGTILKSFVMNGSLANNDQENAYYDLFKNGETKVFNNHKVKSNQTTLTLADYIDHALYVENEGFDFKIIASKLVKAYREVGLLKAVLEVDRTILNTLDDNNVLEVLDKGVFTKETIIVNIDPYLPNNPKISLIKGEYLSRKPKGEKKRSGGDSPPKKDIFKLPYDNNVSIGLSRTIIGSLSGHKVATAYGSNNIFGENIPTVSYREILAGYINYRKGLFKKAARPTSYLLLGLKFSSISVASDISSFSGSGGLLKSRVTTPNNTLADLELISGSVEIKDSDDFKEVLSITQLSFDIGYEHKVIKKGASGLFLGLKISPMILLGGTGNTNGTFRVVPDSDSYDFPQDTDDIPDVVLAAFQSSIGELGIKPSSNVSFALTPLIRYQKMFSRKIGFEFGASYSVGLSSYLKNLSSSIDFLNSDDVVRTASILEDYLHNSKMSSLNLNLGFVYLLN